MDVNLAALATAQRAERTETLKRLKTDFRLKISDIATLLGVKKSTVNGWLYYTRSHGRSRPISNEQLIDLICKATQRASREHKKAETWKKVVRQEMAV